jgi:hypothetical protein
MRELDLDKLLRSKREETISVSINDVDSWLKGGIAIVGLFAYLKWLFTKKMWLMLTSISSISIVSILTIVQINSSTPTLLKSTNNTSVKSKEIGNKAMPEKVVETEAKVIPAVEKGFMNEMYKMTFLSPQHFFMEHNSIEPVQYAVPNILKYNESKDHFTRIDANGFVRFTLVNGSSCSIQNLIPTEDGEPTLNYSIKNGTLYLNSAFENKAQDLIITVTDLEKIKLNGFCEVVTNSSFESTDLEIDINGFINLSLDLNVKDLEIDMNGETKGKLNLKGKYLDFESNGFVDVEIESDYEQSRIGVNGFSKIQFVGTSTTTIMEVTGDSKLSAEEFTSQELFLKVSGGNEKFEIAVSEKLDVEISGENTVIIIGSPQIVRQQVTKGSKLKFKEL